MDAQTGEDCENPRPGAMADVRYYEHLHWPAKYCDKTQLEFEGNSRKVETDFPSGSLSYRLLVDFSFRWHSLQSEKVSSYYIRINLHEIALVDVPR